MAGMPETVWGLSKMTADLYGFVQISSTQRLQGDPEGPPGGVQVVLHHLITESRELTHARIHKWWGKPRRCEQALAEFTSVLWASCHPVAVCLKNSRYGSDFPKKSCKYENWPVRIINIWERATKLQKPPMPCCLISLLQPQNSPPCYLWSPPRRSKAEERNDNNNSKTPSEHFPLALWHSRWWFLFLQAICSSARVVGSVFY